jgi:hypothetical protein
MSDDFMLQAIAEHEDEGGTEAWLILWDSRADGSNGSITVSRDGVPAVRSQAEVVSIPAAVVQELKQSGYPQPPTRVIWIKAAWSTRSETGRLDVRYSAGQTAAASSVNVFTR